MFPRVRITADDNVDLVFSAIEEQLNYEDSKCKQTKFGMTNCATIMFLLVFCSIIFGGIVFIVTTSPENHLDLPQSTETSAELQQLKQADFTKKSLRLIERSEWGGNSPSTSQILHHPTQLVIISHTATGFCKTFQECSKKVLSIHSYHSSQRSNDIGYNFLIGGDGSVYVGRGWDVVNFHRNNSIAVCFIGNYLFDDLTTEMINVTEALLDAGVHLGKLGEDYKLVGHNQVTPTQSPGFNVKKIIKTWRHYSPEQLF